jgi:hypothetical protein
LQRALDLAQGLSVPIFRRLRMRRARPSLLIWFALLAWIAGWNVHAGMVLAQAAGQAQLCSSGDAGAPGMPTHGGRSECACCAQALAATTPSADGLGTPRLLPVSGERVSMLQDVATLHARRATNGAPRAPPAI